MQPPSGGCVLKHNFTPTRTGVYLAAAFGRLCVETESYGIYHQLGTAAAFGRLCVETRLALRKFDRLRCSRLRAAVC